MKLKVEITGPTGSGKTRLLNWIAHAIDGHAEYNIVLHLRDDHCLVVERIPFPEEEPNGQTG